MVKENFVLRPEEWVVNYADYLFKIAMYKLNDPELSKDLVQETFFSALKAKAGFLGQASEKTWLTVILNNKITDHFRKRKSQSSLEDYLDATREGFDNLFFDNREERFGHTRPAMLASDWGFRADQAVSDKEFSVVLQDCISKIPPRISAVFLSKYFDEKNADEICNDFNIQPSNYWVIIHRAKLLLRECLERNWFIK